MFIAVLTALVGCERAADPVDYTPIISCEAAYITLRPEPVKEPPKGSVGTISDVTPLPKDTCDKNAGNASFAPKSRVLEQNSGEKEAVFRPSDARPVAPRRPALRIFRRY